MAGKSCLAQILCRELRSRKITTAVYDPLYDQNWDVDYKCDDPAKLVRYLKSTKDVAFFVDECGMAFDEGRNMDYAWLATVSRHWGHTGGFLAQRAIQVPKTMRDQCKRLFLFASSKDDGITHSEEWMKPQLRECNSLPPLTFFSCDRLTQFARYRIIDHERYALDTGTVDNGRNPRHTDKRSRNRRSSTNNGGAVDAKKG